MSTASQAVQAAANKRQRMLLTPEGLALPLTIASRGARAGALLLDLTFIALGFIVLAIVLGLLGFSVIGLATRSTGPVVELLMVVATLSLFLIRYGYFLWFELGPRAATPGKRVLGIRVAARPQDGVTGGRLTAEMVIARNLLRDVEVFLPVFFLVSGGEQAGVVGVATFVWLAVFVLFPFANRDALRAGDVVAGTWVIEASRAKLQQAMSVDLASARDYRFGEEELAIYGEHELQVLETVLRQGNAAAMREVAETICRKIGWEAGIGDERAFLEAFYAALRARLEQGMRFGQRKKDKFS